jgi:hypothetical protein
MKLIKTRLILCFMFLLTATKLNCFYSSAKTNNKATEQQHFQQPTTDSTFANFYYFILNSKYFLFLLRSQRQIQLLQPASTITIVLSADQLQLQLFFI